MKTKNTLGCDKQKETDDGLGAEVADGPFLFTEGVQKANGAFKEDYSHGLTRAGCGPDAGAAPTDVFSGPLKDSVHHSILSNSGRIMGRGGCPTAGLVGELGSMGLLRLKDDDEVVVPGLGVIVDGPPVGGAAAPPCSQQFERDPGKAAAISPTSLKQWKRRAQK